MQKVETNSNKRGFNSKNTRKNEDLTAKTLVAYGGKSWKYQGAIPSDHLKREYLLKVGGAIDPTMIYDNYILTIIGISLYSVYPNQWTCWLGKNGQKKQNDYIISGLKWGFAHTFLSDKPKKIRQFYAFYGGRLSEFRRIRGPHGSPALPTSSELLPVSNGLDHASRGIWIQVGWSDSMVPQNPMVIH